MDQSHLAASERVEFQSHSKRHALIIAFQDIARFFDRPTSETVLFSGLPIDFENPSDDDFEHVAARIGLDVTIRGRSLFNEDHPEPPFMVLSDNFPPFVIVERLESGRFAISGSLPESKGLTFEHFKALTGTRFISFSVHYSNSTERKTLGEGEVLEKAHWLRGTIAKLWQNYIYVAMAALFINLIGLVSPIFIMNVYDRILPNQAVSTLWVLATGVMLALIFDYILKVQRSVIIDHVGRKADEKISYLIFEKVLNTQLALRPQATGEFTNRVNQYEFVREFFTSNTISVLIDFCFVFIFLLVIFFLSGVLVVVPALAFILAIVIGLIAQGRIGKRMARASNEAAQRNAMLVETVSTIETVKSLRAETSFLRKWRELTSNSSQTSEEIKKISSGAVVATQLVSQLVSVFIVIGGAYLNAAGDITTGGIVAVVMLSGRAISPLTQITMTIARFRQALLSLKILDRIMEQPEDRPQSIGFVNRVIDKGNLNFKKVSFAYPNTDNAVLSDLNLSIKAGERIGVIGKIGSGKTTLGKLIAGLYMPTKGTLLLDGIEMRQYHPQEVRKAVSFAGQNADLFSGTLKYNLLLANPDATDEDIVEICKKTGVDAFASLHPRGYDMPVGERGERLSGGQKQAVALARLLLAKSKIVYLDEPTGAMDTASEKLMMQTLSQAFDRETTLIISTHRYALLDLVDRLIVLDQGRVIADGPKDKVMSALVARTQNKQ
ncbi:type I secretion system permease/ATPase [Cohaesibacter haloalkalitolerans]|uniref:type I secretion system permease/ATPase n=1 Tax=Cohaesibacter haloalkalitolerans TaxID=1162980 RepID=UPI000E654850|nr:type I secretion system permease/ATPase [Cohaesibacter haloalkalitolerans]